MCWGWFYENWSKNLPVAVARPDNLFFPPFSHILDHMALQVREIKMFYVPSFLSLGCDCLHTVLEADGA